jgi:hypothetical protein
VQPSRRFLGRHVTWIDAVADICLSGTGHPTIMFLLLPYRNSRQMRFVRLDTEANKRKISDMFLMPQECGLTRKAAML